MAKIVPFKAVFYNKKKIKNFADVVSPPYDVINEKMRLALAKKSPFNMVYLILSQAKGNFNKYQQANAAFKLWQKKEVLVKDDLKSIYVYRLKFRSGGKLRERIGFLSLLRLEDKSSKVFPHEHTHTAPKVDRLNLIKEVKANLSPIFIVYKDKLRLIQNLYDKFLSKRQPFISFKNNAELHDVWRVSDPKEIKRIQNMISRSQLCIADGHHRYEVANMYREIRKQDKDFNNLAPYNYCLTYFLDTDSKGLVIWPYNRVIKGLNNLKPEFLLNELAKVFVVKKLNNFAGLTRELAKNNSAIGLYNGAYYILFLKKESILGKILPKASSAYRKLTVTILNNLVLKNILHLELLDKEHIYFTPDYKEAIGKVKTKEANMAFLLNPVKIEELLAVAFAGEKMPPKSTFFYPKATTGILVNKF